MAFEGYIRYGGVELVNNSRLSAYTKNLGIGGYRCDNICPTLPEALERLRWKGKGYNYTTPIASPHPPWYDFTESASVGFAGIHILEWTNIDSSTFTATSQELVGDGGSVQGERYASREMTVRCLLLGTDLLACRHGFNWLTAVLRDGDPCAANIRRRHTYADFLPTGKPWWTQYKRTGDPAVGDNVFQAVRYNGLSTTDNPVDGTAVIGSGNTYAKLSHAEGDPNIQPPDDVLDLLIPINSPDQDFPDEPLCGGHKMEFFVQCPDSSDVTEVYRVMYDVSLLSGPVIVSEHEVGANCEGGAWYEVEFVLSGSNPFVWRWPLNLLGQATGVFEYSQVLAQWLRYKDADLTTDEDLYQAPIIWGEPQTYNGLVAAMFDILAGAAPAVRAAPAAVSASGPIMVVDPLCPPLYTYPPVPQEEFVCAPIYSGPYTTLSYIFAAETLPKFTPTTVRFRLVSLSDSDMRDVKVRLIPPSGSEVSSSIVEFLITYLPARSQMFIDGVRKSIDIRTGDPSDLTTLVWSPAEHLVLSQGLIGSYTFPEIICGRRMTLAIDVPDIYDASDLEFDLITMQRDA